jgi:hypothetical protein
LEHDRANKFPTKACTMQCLSMSESLYYVRSCRKQKFIPFDLVMNTLLGNIHNLLRLLSCFVKNTFFFTIVNYACTPRALKDSGNQILKGVEGRREACVRAKPVRRVRFARYFATCDTGLDSVSYPGPGRAGPGRAKQGDGPVAQTAASKSHDDSYQGEGEK